MSLKFSFFETLFFFFYRILFKHFRNSKSLHRAVSNNYSKFQRYNSLAHRSDLSNQILIFDVEGALLKSSSLFPYFMLVAFEAGGLFRAFILLVSYPFICLVGEEMGLKIMVMICFFAIKQDNFRVGTAVLPKFFLENVGLEIYEVVKRGGKKVGVSNIPKVMIDSFLRDYLEIDVVVGRELKVFCGYFVGLMEERKKEKLVLQENNSDVIGITRFNKSLDGHKLFLQCKEIYMVRRTDKRSWQQLPTDKYPKPLIFHDGRLAFSPTVLATVAMFMWIPFGFILAIFRAVVALTLPFDISIPILIFSGLFLSVDQPNSSHSSPNPNSKHLLYVCNHRTLLDPLYLSFTLKKNFTAVTYSLSRMSEILAPIKTVRLTRNRDQDAKMMERLLKQGDLVVCPEGTTCREPYLLRFSPLFAEMSDNIVPVACNSHVTMFYGTTAGGLKCLDPLFFLLNPSPSYTVQLLDCVSGLSKCVNDEKSRFDVANHVQSELANALGFEPTKLTRRDKYQILAGNDGIACTSKKP
ncbi:probable glycerol-3-phosphate acyltransferase 3 isoform X1 [Pistacia vera]|uniref:probable glycerol-3-phosphate acyltransferase 3 isoform X1 n=2 Tax=Pistacia vera TaxID=55513 RepID=UPI001263579A|nr:probable glycerol-3-phosphate acyltransferase 3 isoform X1 [Pistacia vera]